MAVTNGGSALAHSGLVSLDEQSCEPFAPRPTTRWAVGTTMAGSEDSRFCNWFEMGSWKPMLRHNRI